jgi:hypothetical protein
MEEVVGNEIMIINQVKAKAGEKKMYALARFADLIIQLLESEIDNKRKEVISS